MDILVKWDNDNSINVISTNEAVLCKPQTSWKRGERVKMWWDASSSWYHGIIIDTDEPSDTDSSDDDVPLQRLIEKHDPIQYSTLTNVPLPSSSPQQVQMQISVPCHENTIQQMTHNTGMHLQPMDIPAATPESYTVEGEARENIDSRQDNETERESAAGPRRSIVKQCRAKGLPYVTEKSGIDKPRREVKERCHTSVICDLKDLKCQYITEERRLELFNAYYRMNDLQSQRQWIKTHVIAHAPITARVSHSRKTRTLAYYFPTKEGGVVPVCRLMFLNTLNIDERQIRTVLQKTNTEGILDGEKRGGRVHTAKLRDATLREQMRSHINRFPRMESHYCRQETGFEYLSSELTPMKMYNMYKDEYQDGSYSLYFRVFKDMKLKFHIPKKDMCGICSSYYEAKKVGNIDAQKIEKFKKHEAEKVAVRNIKTRLKEKANVSDAIACFDLEQVLYLPKSNRCEIFYKRRLSCFNFTVYDITTKECECFFWHEGIASRGSNEIASCLYLYLNKVDAKGKNNVYMFCDSCSGQNRNTVLPTMCLKFLEISTNVKNITIHYFEPHHGQSEGDSAHSCVERAVRRIPEIMLPSELSAIIAMSRKNNNIHHLRTPDVHDWKNASIRSSILRCRFGHDDMQIDWTKLKQLYVTKDKPMSVGFKMSHEDANFSFLDLSDRRQTMDAVLPPPVYAQPPKIAEGKYSDITELMSGQNPVISHPDHRTFYQSLRH